MLFEIKSWYDGSVLFSLETDSLKLCLEAAVKSGSDLRGSNLRDSDLRGSNLRCSDLRGSDLRDSDLRGSDLRDSDLRGSDLRGSDLRGAKGLEKFPIQILGHRHFIQTTQAGNLCIGCEEHSFEEWREIAEERGKENGYSAL